MVKQIKLGWHGPHVSEVCFGSLGISPLQGRVSFAEGVKVLRYALEQGINWVDTAEIYDNYPQIRQALQHHTEVKVVSKSYSVTALEMAESIEKARKDLNREVIDFFLLHEQESALTLKGHQGAWEELLKAKEDGRVQYIGISTHAVDAVKAGALLPGIDVIHPIVNRQGLGIIDGTLEEMLGAIRFASELGIGIYAMKVFGGGHLAKNPLEALGFIRNTPYIPAMALGMSSVEEVDFNLKYLAGEEIPEALKRAVTYRERKLYIADWCQGCGRCCEACPQSALTLEEDQDSGLIQAKVEATECVLCGYCGRVCPHFCLKIV